MTDSAVWSYCQKIMRFFQLMGFFLVFINKKRRKWEFILIILALIYILGTISLLTVCYVYRHYMFTFINQIGLIVDTTQIIMPITAHLVILIESIYYKEVFREICNNVYGVYCLKKEDLSPILKRVLIEYLVKLIVIQFFATSIEIGILIGIYNRGSKRITDLAWFNSRLSAQWSFFACRSNYLFFCFLADIIKAVLICIGEDLKYISMASKSELKSKQLEKSIKCLYKKLDQNRKLYSVIWNVNMMMNRCFRWSLVLNLINNFLAITIAIYWNYRGFYVGSLVLGNANLINKSI